MPSELCKEEMPSPFQRLNGEFSEKNDRLDELIRRVSNKLHKLSNTSCPTDECCSKQGLPDLPFRDGHLLDYYYRLNSYSDNLSRLLIEVEKLESLI